MTEACALEGIVKTCNLHGVYRLLIHSTTDRHALVDVRATLTASVYFYNSHMSSAGRPGTAALAVGATELTPEQGIVQLH